MSLFCEEHGCPTAEFEERAFRACLYWRARILAPLIRLIWPGYFNPDFEFIRYLAETPGRRDAMNELAAYMRPMMPGEVLREESCASASLRGRPACSLSGFLTGGRKGAVPVVPPGPS